jgi:23S rRNA pseudouridine2604 synthase
MLFVGQNMKQSALLVFLVLGIIERQQQTAVVALSMRHELNSNKFVDENGNNLRLNKIFRETHSRRGADALIADGRVKINGQVVVDMGRRVTPFTDLVELDGLPYTGWEIRHGIAQTSDETNSSLDDTTERVQEEYIKYWKPVGITSTTDRSIAGNLLDAIQESICWRRPNDVGDNDQISHRIFSVGRLDKDSSGLLLLTSDGRLPNAVLRKEFKRPKTYIVTVNKPIHQRHVERLRAGLIITTDTVRQGKHRAFTAPTLPCNVVQLDAYRLEITLTEGRNRQIRVMLKTVGDYAVVELHRTKFMGIDLSRLSGPGEWTRLDNEEQQVVQMAMMQAQMAPELDYKE